MLFSLSFLLIDVFGCNLIDFIPFGQFAQQMFSELRLFFVIGRFHRLLQQRRELGILEIGPSIFRMRDLEYLAARIIE